MKSAMLCKVQNHQRREFSGKESDTCRSTYACIVEGHETTKKRLEKELCPKYHEDCIAGQGSNSLRHYNLVHKFISMLQAMKIPDAKAALDTE